MRRRGVAILLALGAAGLSPTAAPRPAGAAAVEIGCDQAAVRVQITADSVLDPSCTYTAGFDITTSDTTLDCRGATIDAAVDEGVGILISTPNDVDLTGVTVTDCHVEGFGNNLRVRRDDARFLPAGSEYLANTSDITLADNEFSGSHGVGVYVDAYVSDVTITGNDIHDTGSSGIYLEAGSRSNLIEGNRLVHNGATENGAEGQEFDLGGTKVWYWGTGREALSIDGSTDNVVRRNTFSGNSFGAVFLYENCGEFKSKPTWFERRVPAARNLIEDNDISDELNGVWVGSRMGENVLPMDCSDTPYVDEPGKKITLDHAPDTTIRGNRFTNVTYGVRVEDDGTTVEDNRFTDTAPDEHPVIIGTPYRTSVLDQPVTGTVLRGNVTTGANDSPYRWVDGQQDSTVEGNTAAGAPTGICEGEDPPRQLFVMVVAVAAPNPDGSKPATPDLTIDTLGALTSCRAAPETTTTTASSGPVAPVPAAAVPGSPTYTG
ncbi:MAG: right-handed parallel beta-helix repeat-containing protein [Aquihabitans sp.]